MNILIVVPTLNGGGAERVATLWANGLIKYHKVVLACFYKTDNEYFVEQHVTRAILCKDKDCYNKTRLSEKVRYIKRLIKQYEIDVIIPLVTYVGIYCNIARINTKARLIETVRNNPLANESIAIKRFQKVSVFFADGCIFQTKEQKKFFSKNRKRRDIVLSNPISDDFLNSTRVYNVVPRKIIAVGRLHPQKNYKLMLSVFKKVVMTYKELKLDIYGEGFILNELKSLVSGYENSISFNGRTDDVLGKLLKSDIYIMTSNYEGMPNALMEAMATGLPCISTDCPTGPRDLIQNGINGVLVQTNDEEELYNALINMVSNYSAAIEKGEKAKEDMREYSLDCIISKMNQYLIDLQK